MQQRKPLDFIYFDAGGGHRSAALALQAVLASSNSNWDVRLVNLQELLDPLDVFRKVTGIRLQEIYNLALARGWTLGSPYLLPCMQAIIRLYHGPQVGLLTKYWQKSRPEMVVSLIPNFNRALFESLGQALPGVPLVTILTDMADYPPRFWMERQPQYLVCGTARAVEQAKRMGFPDSHVFRTTGMILRPEFYSVSPVDRASERGALGLAAEVPTACVLFGSEGSNVMYSLARDLGNSSLDVQLILICGRNKRLREKLSRLRTRNKMHVEGFTKRISYYMQLSDFFIGKPGPGSISEALAMGLPVIVERNAWTLPQERYNADWVAERGVGVVLRSFRGIEGAVRSLLDDDRLSAMQKTIARMENRAVFEIPPILEGVFAREAVPAVAS